MLRLPPGAYGAVAGAGAGAGAPASTRSDERILTSSLDGTLRLWDVSADVMSLEVCLCLHVLYIPPSSQAFSYFSTTTIAGLNQVRVNMFRSRQCSSTMCELRLSSIQVLLFVPHQLQPVSGNTNSSNDPGALGLSHAHCCDKESSHLTSGLVCPVPSRACRARRSGACGFSAWVCPCITSSWADKTPTGRECFVSLLWRPTSGVFCFIVVIAASVAAVFFVFSSAVSTLDRNWCCCPRQEKYSSS